MYHEAILKIKNGYIIFREGTIFRANFVSRIYFTSFGHKITMRTVWEENKYTNKVLKKKEN